jgi:hypothetical protein
LRYAGNILTASGREFVRMWECGAGCGWESDAPFRPDWEIGAGFLRITFKCLTCLAEVVRYYDVNARGYVDLAPPRVRRLRRRAKLPQLS